MADERRDQARSFADRVGDRVMGQSQDVYESGAAAQQAVNEGAGTGAAGRYSGEARRSEGDRYEAPSRDRAPGYRAASSFNTARRPITGLLRDFSRQLGTLVRMEATLAKTEMREKAVVAGRNSIAAIIGGILGLAGVVILLMAFVQALSAIMDARGVSPLVYSWLSPLVISLIVFAVSYYLIKKGMDAIKAGNLMPEHTAQSLRDTGEWIKEKVS